jgi:hypothetical protein
MLMNGGSSVPTVPFHLLDNRHWQQGPEEWTARASSINCNSAHVQVAVTAQRNRMQVHSYPQE